MSAHDFSPDTLVEAYIKLRDQRRELKAAFDEKDAVLNGKLEKIESAIRAKLNEAKVKSFSTQFGTAYTKENRKYRVADWNLFGPALIASGRYDWLEKRISAGAMNEILEAGGELPPAVSYFTELDVIIRKG